MIECDGCGEPIGVGESHYCDEQGIEVTVSVIDPETAYD